LASSYLSVCQRVAALAGNRLLGLLQKQFNLGSIVKGDFIPDSNWMRPAFGGFFSSFKRKISMMVR
jgi:hypothetical protein